MPTPCWSGWELCTERDARAYFCMKQNQYGRNWKPCVGNFWKGRWKRRWETKVKTWETVQGSSFDNSSHYLTLMRTSGRPQDKPTGPAWRGLEPTWGRYSSKQTSGISKCSCTFVLLGSTLLGNPPLLCGFSAISCSSHSIATTQLPMGGIII